MPEQVDPIEMAIFAAELSPDTPSIDLHGLEPRLAIDVMGNFLHKEFSKGQRREAKVVKIIHGRGSGALQTDVNKYLTAITGSKPEQFVIRFRTSENPTQANGVTYAVLAPNRK